MGTAQANCVAVGAETRTIPTMFPTGRNDLARRRTGAGSFFVGLTAAIVMAVASPAIAQSTTAPERSSSKPPTLGDLSSNQPASTRKMIERLNGIWAKSNPIENFYLSAEAAELSRELMMRPGHNPGLNEIHLLHQFLLKAGASEFVLQDIERLEGALRANQVSQPPDVRRRWTRLKAIAALRMGEQENCLHHHNAESCLLPIRGGGVHQIARGSRAAVRYLTQLLEEQPDDLEARWLLNLAVMTLGEHPQAVPERWRIAPRVFDSGYDIKRFPDIAAPLGVDVDDLAGGVVMDDFDGDRLLDLLVTGSGPASQVRVFRNNGDGTFTDRTAASGLAGLTGGLNTLQADYNNDGHVDVLILRTGWLHKQGHHPNSLLRNNGDFTFTDVTEEAGLLSFHPTQTAAWFDFDHDGHLDLFIGNESTPDNVHPSELFHNRGNGTFQEVAAQHGLTITSYVKGVVAGDYNNDGRVDLYVSILGNDNQLWRNDGPASRDGNSGPRWRFTNVAAQAGVREPKTSFPGWFWDFDNDGWLDLMVFGYQIRNAGDVAADYLNLPHSAERPRLYRNLGDGTFADVTREVALQTVLHTMGCNFGDLDNDGWLDFYAGTGDPDFATLLPNRMFRNDGAGRFQDVTTSGGFGQLQKGHGIAFGDVDNDGDQDIYSVVGGVFSSDHYPNQLFANPGHGHRWLTLALEGTTSNRSAIGARIKVVIETAAGERELHRVVGSGGSFGASPLRQEIGLGNAESISRLEIRWPSGTVQTWKEIELDRFYAVREGADTLRPLHPTRFALPTAATAHGHQHSH